MSYTGSISAVSAVIERSVTASVDPNSVLLFKANSSLKDFSAVSPESFHRMAFHVQGRDPRKGDRIWIHAGDGDWNKYGIQSPSADIQLTSQFPFFHPSDLEKQPARFPVVTLEYDGKAWHVAKGRVWGHATLVDKILQMLEKSDWLSSPGAGAKNEKHFEIIRPAPARVEAPVVPRLHAVPSRPRRARSVVTEKPVSKPSAPSGEKVSYQAVLESEMVRVLGRKPMINDVVHLVCAARAHFPRGSRAAWEIVKNAQAFLKEDCPCAVVKLARRQLSWEATLLDRGFERDRSLLAQLIQEPSLKSFIFTRVRVSRP